jgi:ABC-type amino acid transport substrate-binding protein
VLKVGLYAHFAPISYSADEDPASAAFNTHLGYEADLLTALEAMEGAGLTFSRTAITEWDGIWLKSAEPAYDIIGGGITILESRRQDATGMPVVTFTSGHITFRQTLLVRAEDAERLSTHTSLNSEVRVGALPGTTGEARLLQLTGLADTDGILLSGTRVETRDKTVVADGTAAYTITAAGASPNMAGRQHLYPPTETMPQVIYLGDTLGESALLEALVAGRIDAIARGEIASQDAAHTSHGELVVTAFDEQIEYGGFTLALEDADLAACIDEKLDYLTDNKNIGYGEWLQDPLVFIKRVEQWNTTVE